MRLAWFCSRLSRCWFPYRRLLRRAFLFRNVLGLYFSLVPMQEECRFGIVGNKCGGKEKGAVFFHARRLRLTHPFYFHVGGCGGGATPISPDEREPPHATLPVRHPLSSLSPQLSQLPAALPP